MDCRAIRSNVESAPSKALQIYRQREIIERGFDQLKNEVGSSRLDATEATYSGKLFIYTIAQALRMSMPEYSSQDERAQSQPEDARGVFAQALGAVTQRTGTKAPYSRRFHRWCRGQTTP